MQSKMMPRRSDDVRMLRYEAESLICDVGGRPLFALNDSASALWELCDGTIRVDEAVDAICAVCGVHPDVALDDIRRTIKLFGDAGLVRWA